MPQVKDFPPIDVGQKQTVTWDGGLYLPDGVTLSNPVVTCTVAADSEVDDPHPDQRLIGSPVIGTAPSPKGSGIPNTAVLQQMQTPIAGVKYLLFVIADNSAGDRPTFWNHITSVEPQ